MNSTDFQPMQDFFHSGKTQSPAFRIQQLEKLASAIRQYEDRFYTALQQDLRKSREEAWVTELGIVLQEINIAKRKLRTWMSPQRRRTNLLNWPSASYVVAEPKGMVLIIGPWNYPVQLILAPLVSAIAAGNTVVVKCSEHAPHSEQVLEALIQSTFEPAYIRVLKGPGEVVVPELMRGLNFDHVFFTGSPQVGKIIYQLAAEKLLPVTLELGGKNPCVVEADANLTVAAKRIAVAKFSNAGQLCVAPDFILVHASVKEAFVAQLKMQLTKFFCSDAQQSASYGRIINERQFNRLLRYLQDGTIVHGGRSVAADLYIEPTVLFPSSVDTAVMNDEIFGPILPIVSFEQKEEALAIIRRHRNPLAAYVFSGSRQRAAEWLVTMPSGGACINNAAWQVANGYLPFGGRGNSGIGAYHGKAGFEVFSHLKSVLRTPTWFDPSIKYPPFTGRLSLFKKFIG